MGTDVLNFDAINAELKWGTKHPKKITINVRKPNVQNDDSKKTV